MSLTTTRIYRWCVGVKLASKVTPQSFDGFVGKVKGYGRIEGIVVDASAVIDYSPQAIAVMRTMVGELSLSGLKFVAFVHPFEVVRTAAKSQFPPMLTVQTFGTVDAAKVWMANGCKP